MTAIISKRGELLQLIYANKETIALNKPLGCLAVSDPPSSNMYYRGWWAHIPKQPSTHHIFDYNLKQWIDPRSLDEAKDQKWSEIKIQRETAEYGGFSFLNFTFESDVTSQARIIVASDLGVSVDWTLKDNSIVSLDAEQLRGLRIALAQHVSNCHSRSRIARQLIYDSESIEQIESIQF
ncbi:DUF4376 domain-containing protein [Acinetobacter sp. ULE_I064]|uniref:DUF4376 domain-containing protein n=1 Tax=unclassified Acinetobacter TaxID=196816 RepID=UPI003AF66B70